MSRFRGRFNLSLDSQGRINIPTKFRKAMASEEADALVICRAPAGCLRAYSQNTWNKYEDEIARWPQTPETLRHKTLLYSTLYEAELDTQGRITLPTLQIEIAGIVKNVTLIGQNGFFEIWAADRLNAYLGAQDDFDEVFFKSVASATRNGEH
jgi:MraZ protein